MFKRNNLAALAAFSAMMLPQPAFAAGLNGGELSFVWAVPFIGVLLCIAICPLVVPNFWHHHFGKVAVFWALACAVPMFISYGGGVAVNSIAHALIAVYHFRRFAVYGCGRNSYPFKLYRAPGG